MKHLPALLALVLCLTCGDARAGGQLAIIIDDLGYNSHLGERSLHLPGAFTYAILPRAPQGPRLARLASRLGKEVMVHNPMSNTQGLPLDPGALSGEMSYGDFSATLQSNLNAIPGARGLNNHMGSQLTSEPQAMGWLMGTLRKRGLYFIDSRTTAASRAWETARRYRVPSLQRDIFLDHERDPAQIRRQLAKAIELARERGHALAIGHPYPETLSTLEEIEAMLAGAQVTLVPVSQLLKDTDSLPTRSAGSCLAPPMSLWRPPRATEPATPLPLARKSSSFFCPAGGREICH